MRTHSRSRILFSRLVVDERGVALVAALGVSLVLGILSATAVAYSSTNYGTASRSKADQSAYALGEAGINNAMAVLSLPTNNPFNPYLLPTRVSTYDGGTTTWCSEWSTSARG